VAIALTKGNVIVLGSDYKVEWSGTVPGEIVDLDVSNGSDPHVAVVFSGSVVGKPQKIAFMKKGKVLSSATLRGQVSQLALSPDGDSVFAYGNEGDGQYIGYFGKASDGQALSEIWHHGVETNAHYTQTLFVSEMRPSKKAESAANPTLNAKVANVGNVVQAILGVEQVSAHSRQSEVVGLDSKGTLMWRLPVTSALGADEGAFLYAQSWAPAIAKLAIATDDRHLGVFQVTLNNKAEK
jgi:hypothetical protein